MKNDTRQKKPFQIFKRNAQCPNPFSKIQEYNF